MIEGTMSGAATAMNGELCGADARYRGVSIDSRTVAAGELFVALRGPNFDGAHFIDAAGRAGAAGAVTRGQKTPHRPTDLPTVRVDDTRRALGRLATDWRAGMPATVIGLTGSNGKTTLKEMVASCLSPVADTLATRGNLNNDLGVPLMLFSLSPAHRYAVLEMGANHPGEIAYLTSLVKPAIVAITNAAPAHLEGFGSLDGVARAKGEILEGEDRPRAAILNADDRYFELWRSMAADVDVVSFGTGPDATVSASAVRATGEGTRFDLSLPSGTVPVRLPLPGAHNVTNACAAAAVALAAGLDDAAIRAGLESVGPVGGRLHALPGLSGASLFDDSYNANPESVIAAARFVAGRDGEGWLALGDMGELGDAAARLHRDVGRAAKEAGVARLFAIGPSTRDTVDAFGAGGEWFDSHQALIAALRREVHAGVNLLVKGSRAMNMERVVAALRRDRADGGEA